MGSGDLHLALNIPHPNVVNKIHKSEAENAEYENCVFYSKEGVDQRGLGNNAKDVGLVFSLICETV